MNRPIPHSHWVVPGRLLAGEYPIGADYSEARSRLANFKEAGINHFVNLTEAGEYPAYRHLLPVFTKYLSCPIIDSSVPSSPTVLKKLLAEIRAAVLAKRSVYVHCRAGIGRTNLVVGCYLAEELGDGKRALRAINELWLANERSRSWPTVPQTTEQADYVRAWPSLARQVP